MKRILFTCVILAILALLPSAASAQPSITIYTDKDVYQPGDTIKVSLSAQNHGDGMYVAVYVGLLVPDGGMYTTQFDGWSAALEPWIPEVYVPSSFTMDRTPLWLFDVPCRLPPIEDAGNYSFAVVLTHPWTFDWVSTASLAPFTLLTSPGSDYYVDAEIGDNLNDGSEGAPWKTIAHALASVDGSEENHVTIHVLAGTYASNTNDERFPLRMKSQVSLSGEDRDTTILDARGAVSPVIYCDDVHDLTIDGFTITGGRADGTIWPGYTGGGIYCSESSPTIVGNTIEHNSALGEYSAGGGIYCYRGSPTIASNWIMENTAGEAGGGVHCENSSAIIMNNTIRSNTTDESGGGICCRRCSPTIISNTIERNRAHLGGGIYCWQSSPSILSNRLLRNSADGDHSRGGGIYCWQGSSPTIQSNVIVGNSAVSDGGGICSRECSPTIVGNTIKSNSAISDGGGIHCWQNSPAIVWRNTIERNSAGSDGGGICCKEWCSATIIDNTVRQNSAAHYGGGIDCLYSSPTIECNVVNDNAADYGGGIFCSEISQPTIQYNRIDGNSARSDGGGIVCITSWPGIKGNVITGNRANKEGSRGGGVYCSISWNSPIITNNTIVGNWASYGGGIYCRESSPRITDCILWGNGNDLTGCSVTYCCIEDNDAGEGNIHDDPMFVTGPLGEYYLHPDSPCIDAGSRSAEYAGLSDRTTEANGTPDTGTVDMGFHYPIP